MNKYFRPREPTTPILKSLHWLPISRRIDYNTGFSQWPTSACMVLHHHIAGVDHSISAGTIFAVFLIVKTLHFWFWRKHWQKMIWSQILKKILPQNSGIIFADSIHKVKINEGCRRRLKTHHFSESWLLSLSLHFCKARVNVALYKWTLTQIFQQNAEEKALKETHGMRSEYTYSTSWLKWWTKCTCWKKPKKVLSKIVHLCGQSCG